MINRKKGIWFYLSSYRFNSILARNFLLFLVLLIILTSALSYVFYASSSKDIERELGNINANSLYRIKDIIDKTIHEARLISAKLSVQTEFRAYMMSPKDYKEFDDLTDIDVAFELFIDSLKHIDSVYFYLEQSGEVISRLYGTVDFDKFADRSWYDRYATSKSTTSWIQVRRKEDNHIPLISVVTPVFSRNDRRIGAVIVNLNIGELGKVIASTENNISDSIYILDGNGTIFYSKEKELITKNIDEATSLRSVLEKTTAPGGIITLESEKVIVSTVKSGQFGLNYVSIFPIKGHRDRLESLTDFMVKIILGSIVITILLSFVLATRSFQPLKRIISMLENPEDWQEHDVFKKHGSATELKYITGSFLNTINMAKQVEGELKQRVILLNKAQAAALQAQINPHFLYNAFDTIKWMAVDLTGGKNELSTAIEDLSLYFRSCLDMENNFVTIAYEIEHTRLYLKILQVRYKDKFNVIWQIDDEILNYKILRITLQPIVENAIYHGIKPKRENGTVTITGRAEEGNIILEVMDDGVGMTEEYVEKLNAGMKPRYIMDEKHIGIGNVNQRIKLIYGTEYGVTVKSEPREGTTIRIIIPGTE